MILIAFYMLVFHLAAADEFRSKINEGYDYYGNGEYDKAADYFGKAGVLKPDKPLPNFDKGTALYKSNDFEGAAREFAAAIEKQEGKYLSDFYYNLGNSYYQAGKYKEAAGSYIESLKRNPDDTDAKHNLELSIRKEQQQQKQQENQDQKNDQQDKQQQKNDQNSQDKQQQENGDKQSQQPQKQEEKQDQEQMKAEEKEGEMTEEEAKSLLARFAEDEKEIQKELKQVKVRGGSANDW